MSNNREALTLTRAETPPPGKNDGVELAADFFGQNGLVADFFGSAYDALIGAELESPTAEALPTPEKPQPHRELAKVILNALNDINGNRGVYLMSAYVEATRSKENIDVSASFNAFLDELSARLEKYQITDYKNAVRQTIVIFRQFIPEIRKNKAERLAIKKELHAGINAYLAEQKQMEELAALRANPEINDQLRTRYTSLVKKHLTENGAHALFIQFIDNQETQDVIQDFINMGVPVADAAEMLLDTANYSELIAGELLVAHNAQLDAGVVQEQFALFMQARVETLEAAQPEQKAVAATGENNDGTEYRIPRRTLLKLSILGFVSVIALVACLGGQEVEPVANDDTDDQNTAEVTPIEESENVAPTATITLTRVPGNELAVTTTESDNSQFNLSFNHETKQIEFEQSGTVFVLTILEAEGPLGEQITLFNTQQGETIFNITWHADTAPELTILATGQKVALDNANVLESFQNIIDAAQEEVEVTASESAVPTPTEVPTEQPTVAPTAEPIVTATVEPTERAAEPEIESALAGKEQWDYAEPIVFSHPHNENGKFTIEKVYLGYPSDISADKIPSPSELAQLGAANGINAKYCSFENPNINSDLRFYTFGKIIDTIRYTISLGGETFEHDVLVSATCGIDAQGKSVPIILYTPIESSSATYAGTRVFEWNSTTGSFGNPTNSNTKLNIEDIQSRLDAGEDFLVVWDTYNSAKNGNSAEYTIFFSRLVNPNGMGASISSNHDDLTGGNSLGNPEGDVGIAIIPQTN